MREGDGSRGALELFVLFFGIFSRADGDEGLSGSFLL